MARPPPVWRSMLFVPVTAPRFVSGAAGRGADAVILDLEDSVATSAKEQARELLPDAIRRSRHKARMCWFGLTAPGDCWCVIWRRQ